MIDAAVDPVDQTGLDPVVDKSELPQSLVAVAAGAGGIESGVAATVVGKLVHPLTVCVTV